MSYRMVDYTVQVSLLQHLGKFGTKRGYLHEFRFCAAKRSDAVTLAAQNVPSRGYPFDERVVRVVNSLPVFRGADDE